MKPETYTLFVASDRRGTVRTISVPFYALHVLAALAVVGGITVTFAAGSYTRMLWKVANYNALVRKHNNLEQQYQQLQKSVTDNDQRLSSLQNLATEVATTYGFVRLRTSPFGVTETDADASPDGSYEQAEEEFDYLQKNTGLVGTDNSALSLVPSMGLGEMTFEPTLWPVVGRITASFGERLDPFSGEGAFHTGVDISAQYGDAVRATADGVVLEAGERGGYGRLVVINHGFGVTTFYGHLSTYTVSPGLHVKRGDIIGYVGVSGRTTGPHVHYEVRINDAPVNPVGYLRFTAAGTD